MLRSKIHKLINCIWNKEKLPEQWNKSIIIPAYKKGDKSECSNYRGPPLWSSGQKFWLQIQGSRGRFPALPDLMSSSGSGTGSTQPREEN
jgi:hypothetical protein